MSLRTDAIVLRLYILSGNKCRGRFIQKRPSPSGRGRSNRNIHLHVPNLLLTISAPVYLENVHYYRIIPILNYV